MTTITIKAKDSATAMEEIVAKLGADAYILGTKKNGNEIEVRATNDPIHKPAVKRKPSNKFNSIINKELLSAEKLGSVVDSSTESLKNTQFNNPTISKNFETDIHQMRSEFGALRKMLQGMIVTETDGVNESLGKSTRVRLLQAGFSPDLITELSFSFEGKAYEMGRVNFLRALAKRLVLEDSADALGRASIIFVVGGVGSGKTTLAAKLAAYLVDQKDIRSMALASFDKTKNLSSELLKSFSRLINVPNFVVTESDIQNKLSLIDQKVVVDVSCEDQIAVESIENVRNALGATNILTIVATSVGSSSNAIAKELNIFESLNPVIGLTKFDRHEMCAHELSTIAEKNRQVGFFTGTKSIINAISVMKEDVLAQYLKEKC